MYRLIFAIALGFFSFKCKEPSDKPDTPAVSSSIVQDTLFVAEHEVIISKNGVTTLYLQNSLDGNFDSINIRNAKFNDIPIDELYLDYAANTISISKCYEYTVTNRKVRVVSKADRSFYVKGGNILSAIDRDTSRYVTTLEFGNSTFWIGQDYHLFGKISKVVSDTLLSCELPIESTYIRLNMSDSLMNEFDSIDANKNKVLFKGVLTETYCCQEIGFSYTLFVESFSSAPIEQ